MRNCVATVAFVLLVSTGRLLAEPPTTTQVLDEMRKLRSELPNKVQYLMYREVFKEGSKEVVLRTVQNGEVIHDQSGKRWVCIRHEEVLDTKSKRKEITSDPETWQQLSSTPYSGNEVRYYANGQLRNAGNNGVFSSIALNKSCEFPDTPIDFRMLGLALPGDYVRFNFESIVKTLSEFEHKLVVSGHSFRPEWVEAEADGIAMYYFTGCKVEVDVLKDFWPVRHELITRKKILGQNVDVVADTTRLELEQVDGTWVPKYAEIVSSHERKEIFMSWSNIEKPENLDLNEALLSSRLRASSERLPSEGVVPE